MHVDGGNLLYNDGSVEQVDDDELRKAIDLYDRVVDTVNRSSRPHFLFPRSPVISVNDN
jgi:prepilin-type processing-associated H-X9-DG protein